MFTLPDLPFESSALLPLISEETLDYHYGKHHRAYVEKLNTLILGTEFEGASLEKIITSAPQGAIFNNAAQTWNHTFYRNCLRSPREDNFPEGGFAERINQTFGSFEKFREEFSAMTINNFGSGWTWLVRTPQGTLEILNTSNAGTPLTQGLVPLLTIDVREHAYYLQHKNARAEYVKNRWKLVNRERVAKN